MAEENLLFLFNLDYLYCFSIPILPYYKLRDGKGRFRTPNQEEIKPIFPFSKIEPLIGNFSGEGSLRFTHKDLLIKIYS
jgi:hypothetical protein